MLLAILTSPLSIKSITGTQEATLKTNMVDPACSVYDLGGFHHVNFSVAS